MNEYRGSGAQAVVPKVKLELPLSDSRTANVVFAEFRGDVLHLCIDVDEPVQPAAQQPKQGVAYAGPAWIDRGFKTDVHGRTVPTVTVGFNPDDWDARDAFALRASHGQAPPQVDEYAEAILRSALSERGARTNGDLWVLADRTRHVLRNLADSLKAAQQAPDPGPPSATVEEAARHVGKWLNERPNRPLDLRDVAMLAAHAQQAPAGAMLLDELRSMIEGMSVSVDVSTDDATAGHRYFGTVTEVMECRGDKHGLTLLVQDAEPNFTQADSVQEDADRYRWLRQHWFTMSSNYQQCITFKLGEPRWSEITETELDATIDAARAAQKEGL